MDKNMTGIYVEKMDSSKLIESKIEIEEAIEIYKDNPGAFYPKDFYRNLRRSHNWQKAVGNMIASMYNVKSIVDFGCGIGSFLEGFKEYGSAVKGFEYLYDNAKPYIDESVSAFIEQGNAMEDIDCGKFDCVMSIEVAEHILEEASDKFVQNLTNASERFIFFTAATEGQSGSGHINGQPHEFWFEKFEKFGFVLSKEDTEMVRKEMAKQPFRNKYMKLIQRTIMVLKRSK